MQFHMILLNLKEDHEKLVIWIVVTFFFSE